MIFYIKLINNFNYFQSIFFNNFFSQGIIKIEDYEENYL